MQYNMGAVQHDLSQLDDSVHAYKKAAEIIGKDKNFRMLEKTYNAIAVTLKESGRKVESDKYFQLAVEAKSRK